jgi:hypothetical protein
VWTFGAEEQAAKEIVSAAERVTLMIANKPSAIWLELLEAQFGNPNHRAIVDAFCGAAMETSCVWDDCVIFLILCFFVFIIGLSALFRRRANQSPGSRRLAEYFVAHQSCLARHCRK